MSENEDQEIDNQDENNDAASGEQNQDNSSNQGSNNQGDNNDDQGEHQSRSERRHERFEAFQAARKGFDETTTQERDKIVKRDSYDPLKYGPGTEYDVEQLEGDRKNYGESKFAQGVEQQRFYDQQERYYDRIEIDSDYVANRYPFLDEESDEFDPELNGAINEAFFEAAGYDEKSKTFRNTEVRYKPFVQRYVKAFEKFAASRNAESANNLASQRGRTGVRPSGGGRKGNAVYDGMNPADMTDEQLDAMIARGLGR